MFDALRNRFRFTCPDRDVEVERPLSAFREIARLAGAAHPPSYRVVYACSACGGDHAGLVSEHALDCAAITPPPEAVGTFLNLVTGRHEPVVDELADLAERQLRRGNWPWTFFCACEHDVRPGYPSRLRLIAPAAGSDLVGVAVSCATCGEVSVNIVSQRHLDQPFFHDPVLRYVERPLPPGADIVARFRHELWSGRFDDERNRFAA